MKQLLIFCDIDGTLCKIENGSLFNEGSVKVSQKVKDAIKLAQDNKVIFITCTGNGYLGRMKNLIKELNCQYSINADGSQIKDVVNDIDLFTFKIKSEDCKTIIAEAQKNSDIFFCALSSNCFYLDTNKNLDFYKVCNYYQIEYKDIKNCDYNDILRLHIYTKDNNESIVKIKDLCTQLGYKDNYGIFLNLNLLDICAKNVHKLSAVQWLVKYLNVNLEDVMVIGDSFNDFELLSNFTNSYAMGNAPAEVKAVAAFTTDSVDQDGAANAIIDFLRRKSVII